MSILEQMLRSAIEEVESIAKRSGTTFFDMNWREADLRQELETLGATEMQLQIFDTAARRAREKREQAGGWHSWL